MSWRTERWPKATGRLFLKDEPIAEVECELTQKTRIVRADQIGSSDVMEREDRIEITGTLTVISGKGDLDTKVPEYDLHLNDGRKGLVQLKEPTVYEPGRYKVTVKGRLN